jgi:hypothetical protein
MPSLLKDYYWTSPPPCFFSFPGGKNYSKKKMLLTVILGIFFFDAPYPGRFARFRCDYSSDFCRPCATKMKKISIQMLIKCFYSLSVFHKNVHNFSQEIVQTGDFSDFLLVSGLKLGKYLKYGQFGQFLHYFVVGNRQTIKKVFFTNLKSIDIFVASRPKSVV